MISGIDATVPVTSRRAYSFLSAGVIFLNDRLEVVERKRGVVAGNRLKLIGCSASDAKPAPRERRNEHTTCGDKRLDDERKLVADSAGRVLVGGRNVPRETAARLHHRFGEVRRLARVHAAAADRHRKRRHLVVGDLATREAIDEFAYLRAPERMSLALLVQYQFCDHADIIPNREPLDVRLMSCN